MNTAVESLKSTTFAEHRFTRKQLSDIQQTVNTFTDLSYRELGNTVCEHLNWYTPGGALRIQTCLNALEEMQAAGLFTLPPKAQQAKSIQKKMPWTEQTCQQPEINGSLEQFTSITLQKVTQKEDIALWNEFIDRQNAPAKRNGIHLPKKHLTSISL